MIVSISGDDWAAALDDFDTSLDAQAAEEAAGPSKEEQELAAAKALVRGGGGDS